MRNEYFHMLFENVAKIARLEQIEGNGKRNLTSQGLGAFS